MICRGGRRVGKVVGYPKNPLFLFVVTTKKPTYNYVGYLILYLNNYFIKEIQI